MRNRQDELVTFIADKLIAGSEKRIDFAKKYKLNLPIQDKESFIRFNEYLKTNTLFKHDVCLELRSCIDKDYVITRSFVRMMKTFITKDVAMQYTLVRQSSDKENPKDLFKMTEFCKCMDSVMLGVRLQKQLETTDKDLISSMSDVLCNAKNWNKGRK